MLIPYKKSVGLSIPLDKVLHSLLIYIMTLTNTPITRKLNNGRSQKTLIKYTKDF